MSIYSLACVLLLFRFFSASLSRFLFADSSFFILLASSLSSADGACFKRDLATRSLLSRFSRSYWVSWGTLRATSLDELPQLWNVFKGDMSLIGPRPERPEFVDELAKQIPFYNRRHMVLPGLTGWAQVNYPYGASWEDSLQKLQYDLFYIKNRSLFLDLEILLRTISVVINKTGAR